MDRYIRRAKIIRVVDGDTLYLDIDLGYGVMQKHYVRLANINAPEINTPEGLVAKKEVQKWAFSYDMKANPEGWVWVLSVKDRTDKYDRYLAYLTWNEGEFSINDILLEKGLAVEYKK